MYSFDRNEYECRMKWFLDARFGMFIHWGLYAYRRAANGCAVRSKWKKPTICAIFTNLIRSSMILSAGRAQQNAPA